MPVFVFFLAYIKRVGQNEHREPRMIDKDTITKIDTLKNDIKTLQEALFKLETEQFYQNADQHSASTWIQEDLAFLQRAQAYRSDFNALSGSFFGYPGNLTTDSPLVSRLRHLEAEMFYINNAGDPYEQGDSALDGKVFEREVLALFYEKFGMDEKNSWGYVTSGGSESNTWAIRNGFRKYPNGRLYFCEAAHYSVLKAVTNGSQTLFPYTVIPQLSIADERIDQKILIDTVIEHYREDHQEPILLMTWGTTKLGSCDQVSDITSSLRKLNIPYYCHVDAAYFGGIPNHQLEAPVCPSLQVLGADSVSVSFHKFFGVPDINSVVLSKDKADGNFVAYLGHRDTTVSGSRTFSIFSALQRIKEVLHRSPDDFYCRNIRYVESKLVENRLSFFRAPLSSIFVIPCPSKSFLKKYNLASFEGASGKITLAHMIINPFHTQNELDVLISDLYDDQKHHPHPLDL